jgi:hypothetical protein
MMDWLQTPLSGSGEHSIAPWAFWHARAMVLGWGVLLPLGALLARFFKVTRSQNWPADLDNKTWWCGHLALQYIGVALVSIGVVLSFNQGPHTSLAAQLHAWAGWSLFAAAWVQVLAGWLRGSKGGPTDSTLRGDHYDMTRRRLVFEHLHKSLGWLAVLVAVGVIVSGLVLVDAPRWMLVVLCVWWLALTAGFALLQKRGLVIDTYQAIWGPDLIHPGNRRPQTGWGVSRPLDKR